MDTNQAKEFLSDVFKSASNRIKRERGKPIDKDPLYCQLLNNNNNPTSEELEDVINKKYKLIMDGICKDIFKKKYNIDHASILYCPPSLNNINYPISSRTYNLFTNSSLNWSSLLYIHDYPMYCKFILGENSIICGVNALFDNYKVIDCADSFIYTLAHINNSYIEAQFKPLLTIAEKYLTTVVKNIINKYCEIFNIDKGLTSVIPYTSTYAFNNILLRISAFKYLNNSGSDDRDILLSLDIGMPFSDVIIREEIYKNNTDSTALDIIGNHIIETLKNRTKLYLKEYDYHANNNGYMSTWGDIHNHYYKNTTLSKLIIDHNSEFIRCFNDIKNDIIKSSQTDLLGSIIKTTIDLFNNKTYMFSDMATNIKYLNKNMWPMIIVCEY